MDKVIAQWRERVGTAPEAFARRVEREIRKAGLTDADIGGLWCVHVHGSPFREWTLERC